MKKNFLINNNFDLKKSSHFCTLFQVEHFLEQITKVTQAYCVTKKIQKLYCKNTHLLK